jgi:hypothetical protein
MGGGPGGGGGGLMALIMGGPARAPGDTVLVVVTDIKGDTVRSFFTNARPGALRWVTWDMRRDRATRELSPSALRDSIVGARRMAFLRDSLRTAAGDTAAGQRPGGLQALLRDPEPREPGSFNNPLQRVMGGGGGGGGGRGLLGGGAGAMVEPGTYLITIRMNGRDYKQVARIERPVQTSALSGQWQ